jgi:hypothetical protein
MIEDALLRELKARAVKEGRTLQEVANDAMRRGLRSARGTYKLELQGWPGELRPGIDLDDRDRLYDQLDEPAKWSR